jgi:hypothetical protein
MNHILIGDWGDERSNWTLLPWRITISLIDSKKEVLDWVTWKHFAKKWILKFIVKFLQRFSERISVIRKLKVDVIKAVNRLTININICQKNANFHTHVALSDSSN